MQNFVRSDTHDFSKTLFLLFKDFQAPPKSFPYILIWIVDTEMEGGFLLLLFTIILTFRFRHPAVQVHRSFFLGDSVGVGTINELI